MPDSIYLAMTAAEIETAGSLPDKLAYMACHFSSYGTGLSNLPSQLPEGSILILNDRTPICGHDGKLIAQQLTQMVEGFGCRGVLLDLQRPDEPGVQQLAQQLCHALPDRIAISHHYAKGLPCPVFLPPLPVGQKLSEHIAPWAGRELWLDVCCEAAKVTVTAQGSRRELLSFSDPEDLPFCHDLLHCSYKTAVHEDHAEFTLCRTHAHLPPLMEEAKALGITCFIGLYQEFKNAPRN